MGRPGSQRLRRCQKPAVATPASFVLPMLLLLLGWHTPLALAFRLPAPASLRMALKPDSPSSSFAAVSRSDLLKGVGLAGLSVAGITGAGIAVKAAQAEADVVVRRPFLSERIFDTKRRSFLPAEVNRLMHNKALDQRVVCIGEVHNDGLQHYAEYSILQAVHKRRGAAGLTVGLEMFYRQHQPILDEYVFGKGTLASLKEDTKWDKTWGHKMSYYAKIFQVSGGKKKGGRGAGWFSPGDY